MTKNASLRALILAILVAVLVIAPGGLSTLAQQDAGPQKPPQSSPPPQPPAQPTQDQKGQQGQQGAKPPQYALSLTSNLVNVDAVVTDQDGNILNGLKKENFRVLDEGQPQQITNFAPTDAPITIVILMEFSRLSYWFAANAKYWSYEFLGHLNPKDWVALVTYDLHPTMEVDFTQNKAEVEQAIRNLYFPGFSEANTFDAVLDTIDRLQDVQGKKSILLMASGIDTFSKHTLDQTYKRLKNTDVTIFCVGVAEQQFTIRDGGITYLQAKNQLSEFARLTGGYTWFPRFDGELSGIFQSVTAFLRNQYTIGFAPANTPNDGKYHKIEVQVVNEKGSPLMLENKKHKQKPVIVYARKGYTAPKGSVGD